MTSFQDQIVACEPSNLKGAPGQQAVFVQGGACDRKQYLQSFEPQPRFCQPEVAARAQQENGRLGI